MAGLTWFTPGRQVRFELARDTLGSQRPHLRATLLGNRVFMSTIKVQ